MNPIGERQVNMSSQVIFTTSRGEWHQQAALQSAPENLVVEIIRGPDREQLKNTLEEADFWISERSGPIDAALLSSAPKLKLIQRLGSQVHDIDLQAAGQAGIAVCYLPLEDAIQVAEHLILQMLSLARKLLQTVEIPLHPRREWGESRQTDEDTFRYNWAGLSGIQPLWKKTVGIFGFGEIGMELARRLKGWNCRVWYQKRAPLPPWVEEQLGIDYRPAEAIFAGADYLVNLLPHSPQTKHYFHQDTFNGCQQGAFLVSCGSGGTIDEDALAQAVLQGKLAGAALDTYSWEPLPADSPLTAAARQGANLLLTPHIAAGTAEWLGELPDRSGDYRNLLHYLAGEPLEYQLI